MDRPPSARHAGSFGAIDPKSGRTMQVAVTHQKVEQISRRGRAAVAELATIVPEVLARPSAVLEGMRQDSDNDSASDGRYCYVRVPSRSFRQHAGSPDPVEAPPWPNEVFMVFVNADSVVCNWRWEDADSGDDSLPRDHAARFRKRVL